MDRLMDQETDRRRQKRMGEEKELDRWTQVPLILTALLLC